MTEGPQASLVLTVWPVLIGFGNPSDGLLPAIQRAQIQWRPDTDERGHHRIVGSARCWVPKGTYQRLEYFHDPEGLPCGVAQFPHPYVQPHDGWVDVDPIVNNDPVATDMTGQTR